MIFFNGVLLILLITIANIKAVILGSSSRLQLKTRDELDDAMNIILGGGKKHSEVKEQPITEDDMVDMAMNAKINLTELLNDDSSAD